MSDRSVLDYVKSGQLFGAIEVDIFVPDDLKSFFSEMPPVFKNVVVKRQDIGAYMESFLVESGTDYKDRRYLIGSMFGEKILLITPLLQWYLEHGLIVTRIYQVIEFNPVRAFQSFADRVSEDRRNGDRDPSLKAIADTSKLIGNSFYGYTIMDRSKHMDVKFLNERETVKAINNPRFVALEEFDDFFEVTSKKRRLRLDLPIQIGFFVYQYAKLRMLNFFYDVIDKFISREDYNMLEMDTGE